MTTRSYAFRPFAQDTQSVAVTAVAQTVELNNNNGLRTIRLCAIGTETVFVNFFTTATLTNGFPIPAGQTEVFTIANDVEFYSVIASGIGTTIYSTVGEGI